MMIIITVLNVRDLNLNLLVSFDALMAERNVTRAARRVGLTQSAMSNSLAQLRRVFDDGLFLRHPGGVSPTERALALAGPIRLALSTLDAAFTAQGHFEPSTAERTFTLVGQRLRGMRILPPLLRLLEREAPKVHLAVRPWGLHDVPPDLKEGTVDLMIGFYGALPPGHREQLLFDEEYLCIVRKKHPRVHTRLTLKQYVELSHVLVSQRPGSMGSVDRALAKLALSRRVGARVSHFLMVPSLVAQTDMVAALSRGSPSRLPKCSPCGYFRLLFRSRLAASGRCGTFAPKPIWRRSVSRRSPPRVFGGLKRPLGFEVALDLRTLGLSQRPSEHHHLGNLALQELATRVAAPADVVAPTIDHNGRRHSFPAPRLCHSGRCA